MVAAVDGGIGHVRFAVGAHAVDVSEEAVFEAGAAPTRCRRRPGRGGRLPRLATPGPEEPPPQAAASTPTPRSVATTRSARQSRARPPWDRRAPRRCHRLVALLVGWKAHDDVVRKQRLQGRNAVMFLQHPIGHPG